MTTTDRKSYAVKAETFEQVLDILADVDKDVESLKQSVTALEADVGRLSTDLANAQRLAVVSILTAISAVAFSAFSLWLR